LRLLKIARLCRAEVAVFIHGEASRELVDLCLEALKEVYCSTNTEVFAELHLYASRSEKLRFMESEARELGVAAFGDFKTLHEAWRGYPRIHVSQDDVSDLDRETLEALVAHEAMHSVLHGTPASYIISLPPHLIEVAEEGGWLEDLYVATYMLAAAIKDLEVHREMASIGLEKHLRRYTEFVESQLREACCDPSRCSIAELAETIKLLTPYVALGTEPPACLELYRFAQTELEAPRSDSIYAASLDPQRDPLNALRTLIAVVRRSLGPSRSGSGSLSGGRST